MLQITEYLCEPLRKCLKDEDPYVRKTAAVSVAKLHDINSQLVEEQGFLDSLKDLLSDSNPMVTFGLPLKNKINSNETAICKNVPVFKEILDTNRWHRLYILLIRRCP